MTQENRSLTFNKAMYLMATNTYAMFLIARIFVVAAANLNSIYRVLVEVSLVVSLIAAAVGLPELIAEFVKKRKNKYFLGLGLISDSVLLFIIFFSATVFGVQLHKAVILLFFSVVLVEFLAILALQLRDLT